MLLAAATALGEKEFMALQRDSGGTAARRGCLARDAWTELRRHGFRSLLRRAWRRYVFGQDRVVVLAGAFTARVLVEPGSDGITFGRATEKDLAALSMLARGRAARIQNLLGQGDCWLHVARDGGRLVGYRFATRGYWGYGVLAKIIRVRADQVYIEDLFVHPDYRGRNVGLRLVACQNLNLMTLGFREDIAAVSATNVASLRLAFRLGWRPVFYVDSSRWLFYHRSTVSTALPPEIRWMVDEVGS